MRLDQIKIDDRIYPRPQKDSDNVRSLVEKLKVGISLDSIVVQNVTENGNIKCLTLNGAHRLVAYEEYNKLDGVQRVTDIEVEHWRGKSPIPFEENRDELLIFAHQSNDEQGLNMRTMDTRHTARMLRERHPEWSEEYIGERLNRGHSTIHEHIKDIIQRQQATEHSLIIRLSRLGWTQQEIADHPDVTVNDRSAISKIVKNVDTDKIHNLFYQAHKEVDKIAGMFDIDEVTAWGILLEGKDDIERFRLFGRSEAGDEDPKLMDYWKFAERDSRLGQANYPGNLYGQEALNIIYRFSRQGDLVVDPMAGGGTIIDACLILGRKCRAYDIDPTKSGRLDIVKRDALEPLLDRANNCQLVILDPPYFKKKEAEYGCDDFTKDRDTFLANIKTVAQNCYKAIKEGGYLALLYGQFLDYDDELGLILSFDLATRIVELDFHPVLSVQSPLTFNNQWHGDAIEEAKSFTPWRILPVSKDWQIFKKV